MAKKKRHGAETIEQRLKAAYRGQSVPEPSEQWHRRVMQAVREQGGILVPAPVRIENRVAWHAAYLAIAAAVIMTILGYWTLPSDARLAWQFQREGTASAWLLHLGDR